jgi:hypothetical protein
MPTFKWLAVVGVLGMSGCAFERAQIAQDARVQMVGLNKEQVLSCMGPPASRMAEGQTEVWAYSSGNGHTNVSASSHINGSIAMGDAVATQRFCNVQIVMLNGQVNKLNYSGPTGGLLSADEQCAFAVRNCVRTETASLGR